MALGQIGGYGFYLDLIKSNVIYPRLIFWGLCVPRKNRVIYSFQLITKYKGKKR